MSTPIFEPGIRPAFERRSPPRVEKATAVVLFIGHTEKYPLERCRKLRSMKEYVDFFGSDTASNHAYATLHNAIQLYFDNDGTACYVHSLGTKTQELAHDLSVQNVLQHAADVTLISFPSISDLCPNHQTPSSINRAATICPEKWATLYCALLEQISISKQLFLPIDLPESETDALLCLTALQKRCSDASVLGAAACYWPRIIGNRSIAGAKERQAGSPACVSGAVAALNRRFNSLQGAYHSTSRKWVNRAGRTMAVYLVLIAVLAVAFVRLPSGFLPAEDQGYMMAEVMLPPGATKSRTREAVKRLETYMASRPAMDNVVTVDGWSFSGSGGQNTALAFPVLKDWSARPKSASVQAETVRANQALAGMGVSMTAIRDTLSTLYGSAQVNEFPNKGRMQRVLVQANAESRMTPESLQRVFVIADGGARVPLGDFTSMKWENGAAQIGRYNGYPSYSIMGDAAPGYTSGDAMAEMTKLLTDLPPGIGYEWTGLSYEERAAGSQAPVLLGLALLVVFLVLVALYESWRVPFSVLLIVPVGALGAVLALTVLDMPNDVYFKVGLVTIIGLAAKNAILIVEFAKGLYDEGRSLNDAVLEAARLRFRPIIMTSMAFILGVLPLALASGAGAASQRAIGVAVIGGMLGATFLGVFFVPAFFVWIMSRFGGRREVIGEPSARCTSAELSDE